VNLNRPDDVFLTTEEVLEYLHVSVRTVYRLIKAGKIPAVRAGRQWRFRKRDIDAWLGNRSNPLPGGAAGVSQGADGRRVLIVDDEEGIRELLSRTLALAEYDVSTVPDGAAALHHLRETGKAYNLVIADLRMPGMDGLELIREVKQFKPQLPIIIITGFSSESSAIEAVNLGVAGYLTKPVGIPQVLAAAAKALGQPAA
jgi:two-component system cell cycle response regulator CpdR